MEGLNFGRSKPRTVLSMPSYIGMPNSDILNLEHDVRSQLQIIPGVQSLRYDSEAIAYGRTDFEPRDPSVILAKWKGMLHTPSPLLYFNAQPAEISGIIKENQGKRRLITLDQLKALYNELKTARSQGQQANIADRIAASYVLLRTPEERIALVRIQEENCDRAGLKVVLQKMDTIGRKVEQVLQNFADFEPDEPAEATTFFLDNKGIAGPIRRSKTTRAYTLGGTIDAYNRLMLDCKNS